jgi:hypothetical protein
VLLILIPLISPNSSKGGVRRTLCILKLCFSHHGKIASSEKRNLNVPYFFYFSSANNVYFLYWTSRSASKP